MSGCETRLTKGVQKRVFSRFESARFDNCGSECFRKVWKGNTFFKEFLTGEAEETAYLGVGDVDFRAWPTVELHCVYGEDLTDFPLETLCEVV